MSIETGKAELEIEKKFVGCANSFLISKMLQLGVATAMA